MLTLLETKAMRAFPRKCRDCGKNSVNAAVVDYSTEREHDGRPYSLIIPNLEVLDCGECHARVLSPEARDKVTDALRAAAGLLTPREIRENRKRLGLTQEQLANWLKVAKETVSRWETGGQIQQRSMDLLLRIFFDVPEAREYLASTPSISTTTSVTLDTAAYGGTICIIGHSFQIQKGLEPIDNSDSDPVRKRIIEQIVSWKAPSTAIISR